MSDEMAERVAQEKQEKAVSSEPTGGRSVTIAATLHPNGQAEFSIPKNKIVAGGLLMMLQSQLAKMEMLEDVVKSQQAAASRGGINGLLKRMNGG